MSLKRQLSETKDTGNQSWEPRIPNIPRLQAPPESPNGSSPASTSKRPRILPASQSKPLRAKKDGSNVPSIRKWTPKIDGTQAIMDMLVLGHSKYCLGDFLQHLLKPDTAAKLSQGSRDSLRKWLRGETREGTRPAEIIDAVYRHPFGIHREDGGRTVQRAQFHDLSPPPFPPTFANAHLQSASLLPAKPPDTHKLDAKCVNSREGLEEWMVRGTLVQVEREAQALADADQGLARGANFTWDMLSDPSNFDQRERMGSMAPVEWAIMMTITLV